MLATAKGNTGLDTLALAVGVFDGFLHDLPEARGEGLAKVPGELIKQVVVLCITPSAEAEGICTSSYRLYVLLSAILCDKSLGARLIIRGQR